MRHLKIISGIVLSLCFALTGRSQSIPNPSFEADFFQNGMGYASENGGAITGWVLSNPAHSGLNLGGTNTPGLFADNGVIPDGTNVAFIQAVGETNSISTLISGLVPGMDYQVTFRANRRMANDEPSVSWSLNGGAFVPFTASPAVGDPNAYYTNSATFTATNTTAALVLQNGIDTGDATVLLDNFTVQTVPTEPTGFVVVTNSDSGPGSLRQVVLDSARLWGDEYCITFDPALSGQTITLSNQITITNTVTIDASALAGGIQLAGRGTDRIFFVTNGAFATLKSLVIANGAGLDHDGGGGIYCSGRVDLFHCNVVSNSAAFNEDSSGGGIYSVLGEVHLTDCVFTGNSAINAGGAIRNFMGTLTVTNCTFSENSARYSGAVENDGFLIASRSTFFENSSIDGGAIINQTPAIASAFLEYCTLVSNHCHGTDLSFQGGGAIDNSGDLTMIGCIVAGNTATPQGPDIWMEGTSLLATNCLIGDGSTTELANGVDGNLVGTTAAPIDALLGPLANNGGPTPTLLPSSRSPAIDAGGTTTLTTDQRGFPRVLGAAADIGAVEASPSPQVFNTADSGVGSLRYVVAYNPGSTITFDPALSGQTIRLTNGQISLISNAVIDASALPAGIILDGNHNSRLFHVYTNATVLLDSLTISNGFASGAAPEDSGGGIFNDAGATLTLTNCTVTSNGATWGAGIENVGTLSIYSSTFSGNGASSSGGAIANKLSAMNGENSTFSGNSATLSGGAIYNSGSIVALASCTLSGNSSPGEGGGIENLSTSSVMATNTIVAGNTDSTGTNINNEAGSTFAGANNLVDVAPLLAPLGNYGGRTLTMPPLLGSPAIDAGGATTLTIDQRGFPRVIGTAADIGAAESSPSPVVTTAADSGVGSLRYAVTYMTPGSTITFDPALSGQTILLTNGQISISGNAIIDASALPAGIILDGNHNSRIFHVYSNATVVLDSLTISNGFASGVAPEDSGGGIFNDAGAILTLTNCTVTSNSATWAAGIENEGTLHIYRSTFSGNAASSGGGAVANELSTMTAENSTFSGNSATLFGGAFYNQGSAVVFTNSTISGNSTPGEGGGIESLSTNSVFAVNTIVAGNTAGTGANTNNDADSTFNGSNNLIDVAPLLGPLGNYGGRTQTMPPLAGSPAIDAGGATTLTIDQRGFPRVLGAAVDIGAVESSPSPLVTTAADSGIGSLRYAVTYNPPGSTITFDPSLSGQTILLTNGQISVSNSTVINASALPVGIILDGHHTSRLLHIYTNATVVLDSLTISNGFASGAAPEDSGGGIFNEAGALLTLTNCTVTSNSATWAGGIENEGALYIYRSTFSGNTASSGGGAIANELSIMYTENSTFFGNSATLSGGAFYNQGSMVGFASCTVSGNSTPGEGGGMDNVSTNSVSAVSTIVAGNTASTGANIDSDANSTFNGTNNLIDVAPLLAPFGNYGGRTKTMPPLPGSPAVDAGGTTTLTIDQRGFPRVLGAAVDIGAVESSPSPVVTTTADSGVGSLRYAVTFNPGSTITFDPALSGQTILLTNGQISVISNAVIDASTLPAGIIVDGNHNSRIFHVHTNATVVVNSLTISNGFAGGVAPEDSGGGIFNDPGATLTLTNCIVTINSATWAGGIENEGTLSIYRCTVSGNTASSGGGAIANKSGVMSAQNSTFFGNSAVLFGGAIYNHGSTVALLHCTISGNSTPGEGGGMDDLSTSSVLATNTIVAGNTAGTGGDVNTEAGSTLDGLNNVIAVPPLLAPPGNYGGRMLTMPPQPGSPAIDAGLATTITIDERGFPRPIGLGPDIGAAEGVRNPAGPGAFKGKKLANGTFQLGFTNYSGMLHSVLTSTNLKAPMNTWSNLGLAAEVPAGSGQFQFIDTQPTANRARFYRVQTP